MNCRPPHIAQAQKTYWHSPMSFSFDQPSRNLIFPISLLILVLIVSDVSTSKGITNSHFSTATKNYSTNATRPYVFKKPGGASYPTNNLEVNGKQDHAATTDIGKAQADNIFIANCSDISITCPVDISIECDQSTLPAVTGTATATGGCNGEPVIQYHDYTGIPPAQGSEMRWVFLPAGSVTGSCVSGTNCETGTLCFGLQYTPDVSGILTSYTTGFFINCVNGDNPVISNMSCVMNDNSGELTDCEGSGLILMNNSGNTGSLAVIRKEPVILHQICLQLGIGGTILFDEDENTDLTASITIPGSTSITELPEFVNYLANADTLCSSGCPYPGVIYREFIAIDDCDNLARCIQAITILDLTPPSIQCPSDTLIMCTTSSLPSATGFAAVSDNCDAAPNLSYSDVVTLGSCLQETFITRTWLTTDRCGNTNTCVQLISIRDTIRPVLQCPLDTIIDCTSPTSPLETGFATASDNCDGTPLISFSDSLVTGGCPQGYTIIRKWIAEDDCLNRGACYQHITVQDTIRPHITAPPDTLVDCNSVLLPSATGTATATDSCDPAPMLSYYDVTAAGTCASSYIITRRWTAADACLNKDTCYQIITVQDTSKPVMTCPQDVTITYPAGTDPGNTGSAAATDGCDSAPLIIYLDSIPGQYCPQSNFIKRTWYAIDACGNQSKCSQWITIEDKGTICGGVHDDLGQPIGGVMIQLMADINGNQVVDTGDTLVTTTTTSGVNGSYCFTNIRPCNYVIVEVQPMTYGSQSDFDTTPDPDGDDSSEGPDNQIPVILSQSENDVDNNFVDIICPTVLPTLPYDTICSGQSVVLQINNLNLGALTYSWDFGSGSSPSTGVGLGPHTVSYVTTTQNQMNGASSVITISKAGCIDLIGQVTLIDVNPYPNAAINTSTASICYFTNKIFQPVAAPIPGATYNWTFGSGAVPATAIGYGPHNVYYMTTGNKTAKLVIHPNEAGAQCPDSSTVSFTVLSCPGQIVGYVLSNSLGGIPNVTVKLFEDANNDGLADNTTAVRTVTTSTISPNIGLYVMASLTPGSYVIVETQPSGWLNYDDYDASNDGDLVPNISGIDNLIPVTLLPSEIDSMNNFIELPQPGSITGSVFVDPNGNMVPDNGEGLGSVTLKLLHDDNLDGKADNNIPVASQVTNPNGNYIFSAIPVGSYVLVESNPLNYISVKDYDASNDFDLVPNTNTNNDTIPLTLTNNETDANNYFIDIIACPLMVTNTNNAGYGSLRYNVDCAEPGDTILFESSLAGQTIMITSDEIELDKNLVFISTLTPRVTIASSIMGLFQIDNTITIEFRDLNIMGGNGSGSVGAAFENHGILKLHNVMVDRNPSFPLVQYLLRNESGSSIFLSGSCSFKE
jgi:hypothetical protein